MSERLALAACRQYDHWAREIRRLTDAIGETVCPQQLAEEGLQLDELIVHAVAAPVGSQVSSSPSPQIDLFAAGAA